jgi:hypothetical protein
MGATLQICTKLKMMNEDVDAHLLHLTVGHCLDVPLTCVQLTV